MDRVFLSLCLLYKKRGFLTKGESMESVCVSHSAHLRDLAPPFPKEPKRLTDYKDLVIINNLLCLPSNGFFRKLKSFLWGWLGLNYSARVFVARKRISLADVFSSPDLMCLTEHQVVAFYEDFLLQSEDPHRHHLPTFFLVKNEENGSIVLLSVSFLEKTQGNGVPGFRVRMDTFRGNPKTVLRDVGIRVVLPT
jgi:hypothetical protein